MQHYDPLDAPDCEEWLALDEQERIALARDYHGRARIRVPNVAVHAAVHAIVETQSKLPACTQGNSEKLGGALRPRWSRALIEPPAVERPSSAMAAIRRFCWLDDLAISPARKRATPADRHH